MNQAIPYCLGLEMIEVQRNKWNEPVLQEN